jgi:hypothetical protein
MNIEQSKEYTLVSIAEDGGFSLSFKTGLEIATFLEMIANENDEPATLFLETPISSDSFSAMGTRYMIIKGIPVMPKSKQIITRLVI